MLKFKSKKMLPYIAIPFIIALYLVFKYKTDDIMTIIRSLSLISFGYIAAYSDLKTRTIPNKLILIILVVWVVLMSIHIIIDIEPAIKSLTQSLISSTAGGGFFLAIYFISRKGIGGGDVKLIAVMGLFMTLAKLMTMLFFSSLVTALVSGILLITKRATMKTAIPLVPFLYLGTLIIIFM